MTAIAEILRAAERLDSAQFVKLRNELDRVEDRIWKRELALVSDKHRKKRLTDAKIDEIVARRRYQGARP